MANKVKREIVRIGRKRGESKKEIIAALETGKVESGFRNLSYGDGTSVGWRQETASSYPNVNRRDLKGSINRFYNETSKAGNGKGMSAGQLAQTVQRSAYPGRYDAVRGDAKRIYRHLAGGTAKGSGVGSSSSSSRTTTVTRRTPGVDNSETRKQLVLGLLKTKPGTQRSTDPLAQQKRAASDSSNLLSTIVAVQNASDVPGKVSTRTQTVNSHSSSTGSSAGRQTHAKSGTPVARLKSVGGAHPTSGLAGYPAHDYFAPAGSAAVAPATGRVVKVSGSDPRNGPPNGPHGPFGLSVYIRAGGKTYYLTHMGSRHVKVGERVRQGQKIGTVGDYAKWGGANHIHMGVHG